VTTVMLRNIPSRYNQPTLLQEVYAAGFEGLVDFFYLPIDFQKKTNAGYAFLNFTAVEHVTAFRRRFDGERLGGGKLLAVVPAAIQGYAANRDHLAHSAVLNHHRPEHGPLFLREEPPRKPRPPRCYAYSLGPEPAEPEPRPYLLAPPEGALSALDLVVQRADAYAWACLGPGGTEVDAEAFAALDGLAHGASWHDGKPGEWEYPASDLPTLRESRDLGERFGSLTLDEPPSLWSTPAKGPAPDLWDEKPRGFETPSTCATSSPPRDDLSPPFQLPWLLPPLETLLAQPES